jgi:predicted ArsR family transcriptional regulator
MTEAPAVAGDQPGGDPDGARDHVRAGASDVRDGPSDRAREDAGDDRPATLQEARALAHPLRLRILRLCLDRALTNSELATALGQKPATMLYHVRTLVRTGFLAERPSRPGPRGTVEKPYRATGKSWLVSQSMTSDDGAMLRAIFDAVAAEISEAGPDSVLEGARLAMRLRPDQADQLRAQIRELIAQFPSGSDYVAQGEEPGTEPYAMVVMLHKRAP